MERIVRKFNSFEEAEAFEIEQAIRMTAEERQSIAAELKRRFYGEHCPDVREIYKK